MEAEYPFEPEEEDEIECQIIDKVEQWCCGKQDYDVVYCFISEKLDEYHIQKSRESTHRKIYVEPRDERYSVRLEGNKRASYLVGLQDTAIKLAREMAMKHGYELVVLR